jgi:hypothetical protein
MPTKINKFPFTTEELRELLDYDPETGLFTWKVQTGSRALVGDVAGGLNSESYRQIMIKGVYYKAHRLAWYYHYGVEPREQIDHINGVRGDNRISNLREATHQENRRNSSKRSDNTSGYKGVYWSTASQKFRAECRVNGKKHSLGYHDTAEEAHEAYAAFTKEHHGDFARAA